MNPRRLFEHVWMPPLVQEISERFECVIGCGHVSGLSLQRLIQPRAGMAMREPKADQQIELIGSCTKTALSGPDLSIIFPYCPSISSHTQVPGRDKRRIALMPSLPGFDSPLVSSPWPISRGPFIALSHMLAFVRGVFANATATSIRGLRSSMAISQLLCGVPKRSTA